MLRLLPVRVGNMTANDCGACVEMAVPAPWKYREMQKLISKIAKPDARFFGLFSDILIMFLPFISGLLAGNCTLKGTKWPEFSIGPGIQYFDMI